MDIKQKAVRGVAWTVLQQSGTQFVSFVVFAILSRFLAPDDFGLVALATVFVTFIQIFLDQGFSIALIQSKEVDEGYLNTAFWSNLFFGLIIVAVGIMAAGLIASFYDEPELKLVLQFLFLTIIPHSLSSTQVAILNRKLAFDKLSARTLAAEVVGGVVGIIMADGGYGIWSLVGRNLARDITGLLVLWGASPWRPRLSFSAKHFKVLFTFGINIMGDRLFYFINRNIDQLLIGYFLGSRVLGYYVIGFRLVQLGERILLDTISAVSFPVFARLQNDKERLRSAFLQVSKLSNLVALPCFLGIVLIAPEIVVILFGNKWVPSIPIMQLLSLMYVVQAITFLVPALLLAVGKTSLRLRLRFLKTVGILISILVSVQFGVIVIAMSFVLLEILLSPLMIAAIQKTLNLGIRELFRQFTPVIIGTLIMGFMVLGVNKILGDHLNDVARLFISISLGGLTYGWVVHRIDPSFPRNLMEYIHYFVPRSISVGQF